MIYSNSPKSLFLGLFLILSSQVLAHDVSEATIPISDIEDIRSKLCVIEIPCSSNLGDPTGDATGAPNYIILSDVALDSHAEDTMDPLKFEEIRKTNIMRRDDGSSNKDDDEHSGKDDDNGSGKRVIKCYKKCSDNFADAIGAANHIILSESIADWMAAIRANTWMKNHAKTIPGTRRLLKDFGGDEK